MELLQMLVKVEDLEVHMRVEDQADLQLLVVDFPVFLVFRQQVEVEEELLVGQIQPLEVMAVPVS